MTGDLKGKGTDESPMAASIKDFERSLGEEIEIRTYRPVQHQKEFRGLLTAYDKNSITIETENHESMVFAREDVALARLAFDF